MTKSGISYDVCFDHLLHCMTAPRPVDQLLFFPGISLAVTHTGVI